ncbi:MAG: LrgB family protein [Erysipelotrichaceae bacterium]|nr:LrgB family protein [Erysipelotrichaceae bacterium]
MIDLTAVYASPFFSITISITAYVLGHLIYQKVKSPVANPLLIAILLVIAVLKGLGIPFEVYRNGGDFISLFLAPATAALALTIYSKITILKKNIIPVIVGSAIGSVVSMVCVYLLCKLFNLDATLTASLLPKSVTTPIAMGISTSLGGIAPVTVAAVVMTGIMGSVFAPLMIKIFKVTNPVAVGLAIGACSHAVGTSRALQIGELEGAMSGVAIGVCGLMTVIFAMFI